MTQDEVDKILEAHTKYLNSLPKEIEIDQSQIDNLNRANFSEQDLAGIKFDIRHNYRYVIFAGAKLPAVVFDKVNMEGANFERADLTNANFTEAQLNKANFQSANLEGASLQFATCKRTDFSNAKLINVNFDHGNLWYTLFENADVQGATFYHACLFGARLEGVRNIRESQVGSACLEEISPDNFVIFEPHTQANEAAKNNATLLTWLLVACGYSLVTLSNLYSAGVSVSQVKLSILNVYMAPAPFIWVTPALLLGAYWTMLLQFQRGWETLITFPAVYPDGKPLDRKAYPWLLNGVLRGRLPRLSADKIPYGKLQMYLAETVAYLTTPVTILLFWFACLKSGDKSGSIWLAILCSITVNVARRHIRLAGETLGGHSERTQRHAHVTGVPKRKLPSIGLNRSDRPSRSSAPLRWAWWKFLEHPRIVGLDIVYAWLIFFVTGICLWVIQRYQ